MRPVVGTAGLLAGLVLFAPSPAAAQDPDNPPPPPRAPQEVAVPRGEVRSPRVREERAAPENRAPERAVERSAAAPVRDAASAASTASGPAPAAASNEERGARPRGSVRQPPPRGGSIDGRPIDHAVLRSEAPRPAAPNASVYYPHRHYPSYAVYYDPWGFGSFGVGYFYYSPWSWAPYGYGYGPYPHYAGALGFDVGTVKLKVKPRDAEVWVDGYYAGTIDDFDGMFQALKLDSGPYRIEVRKRGFETLTFDVRVQPERSITFRREMQPIP